MLDGKIAVVTGGSRGIGRAISITLAKSGADVVVIYAGNKQKAEDTVAEIEQLGRRSLALQVDVSQSDQVNTAFKEIISSFGSIDILVNNAGITRDNLAMRLKEEDWDQVIDTNLKGVFLCSKAAIRPMMKRRQGKIINISSVVAVAGNPGQANYCAAKAGVIGLTKSMAKELASRQITVNAIAPGFIDTDMTEVLSEELKQQILAGIPLGRLGSAQDVAEAVRFLASEGANYITGQTLHIDGGMVPS